MEKELMKKYPALPEGQELITLLQEALTALQGKIDRQLSGAATSVDRLSRARDMVAVDSLVSAFEAGDVSVIVGKGPVAVACANFEDHELTLEFCDDQDAADFSTNEFSARAEGGEDGYQTDTVSLADWAADKAREVGKAND